MGTPLLDTVIHIEGVPVAVSAERWSDLLLVYAEALARELARQSAKTRAPEGQLSLFGSSS
jgi:hypothetical protein